MKKSNKLLLGGFLAGLLLITALHITLYAKYKAGDYTIYNAEDELAPGSMQLFPNILFVSMRNIPDATVKFSDTARINKDEENGLEYVRKGDTLLITGKDSSNQNGIRHRAAFSLPYNATLSIFNSSVDFDAGRTNPENSLTIHLQKSQAFFIGANSLRLGNMRIAASANSLVAFRNPSQIARLDVQLSNSLFEDSKGTFGQLSIATDSASHISLQAKHLVKANIKALPSQ